MKHALNPYLIALAAVALAFLIRVGLGEPAAAAAPFLLYLGAVALSSWLGRLGPALFATLLAAGVSYVGLQREGASVRTSLTLTGMFVIEGAVIAMAMARRGRAATERARGHQTPTTDSTVEAVSEGLGRGSDFIVRLSAESVPAMPQARAATPAGDASEGASETTPPSLRVLVVDDHMDSAATLAELLGLWGHQVRSAVDGREALASAATFHPDLVLLDIAMPGMDGYQVVREMRRLPELSNTTMVALTGYSQDQVRDHTREAEIDHHMIKPIDPSLLRRFLAERVPVTGRSGENALQQPQHSSPTA